MADRWKKLAVVMRPRPFFRNELVKFEDDSDETGSGEALRIYAPSMER